MSEFGCEEVESFEDIVIADEGEGRLTGKGVECRWSLDEGIADSS